MNDSNIIGRVYDGTANNLFQKDQIGRAHV